MVGAFVSYRHISSLLLFFQGPSFSTSPLVKLLIEPASLKDGFKFASTITIPDIQFDYTGDYTCRLDQMHSINSSVYVYASGKPTGCGRHTVNSENFVRVLFSRNFADAEFRENKTLAKWRNHSVIYCCR